MQKTKLLALVSLGVLACGGEDGAQQGQDPASLEDASFSMHAPVDAGARVDARIVVGNDAAPVTNTCATATTGVELEPVHLAFAFDVSGSMGNGDQPWYDRTLKWDPVVSATKAFFASDAAQGLSASLTFFPGANRTLICNDTSYAKPDVPFTALPSTAFATAIDAIAPKLKADWRSGTPTLAVLQGTATFVDNARDQMPGRYARVLVTDGYPQSCSSTANKIDSVVAEAQLQLANDLPTYVIGVNNPIGKGGPDTVSDLNRVAAAGGTDKAVLIDTGNPAATVSAFNAAIEHIRQTTISCNVAIPSQTSGRAFDKQSVVVHFDGSKGASELVYDKACTGNDGWHYDDVSNPTEIVLCERTCNTVRADANAKLAVEFACSPVLFL